MYIGACMCLLPTEARSGHSILMNCSCGCWGATLSATEDVIEVLELKPEFSARAASVLNYCAVYSALQW